MSMSKFNNIICNRAFTELHLDIEKKRYMPCCEFAFYKSYHGLENFHKKIRDDNLKNNWSNGCENCQQKEKNNIISHRLTDKNKIDLDLLKNNQFKLKHLELAIDNTCNLACITCNSSRSSKWYAEEKRMFNLKTKQTNFNDNIDWLFDLNLWKDVETLIIFGGEPLFSKKFDRIILWLIDQNFSQKINLRFYTNGTILNSKLLHTKNFKSVDYQFSIDGVGEKFEIIRWPAKWEQVLSNINTVTKINSEYTSINYTISILNIFNLKSDFTFLKKLCKKINLNFVTAPEYYDIKNLPLNIKEKLIEDFRKNFNFYNVVKTLEKTGNENVLFQAFATLKNLDKFRGTDSSTLFAPELLDFINKNN